MQEYLLEISGKKSSINKGIHTFTFSHGLCFMIYSPQRIGGSSWDTELKADIDADLDLLTDPTVGGDVFFGCMGTDEDYAKKSSHVHRCAYNTRLPNSRKFDVLGSSHSCTRSGWFAVESRYHAQNGATETALNVMGPAGDDWLEQMKKVIELMSVILPLSRGLVVV